MGRLAGVARLLIAAILLLAGAWLLYSAYVQRTVYAVGFLLLGAGAVAVAVRMLRRAGRGLGLRRLALSLSVVLAIAVVLAVLIVPSVAVTRQRTRQKRTMSDIRRIAAALEETKAYPASRTPSDRDGWGHAIRYERLPDGYAIGSPGRDGTWQRQRLSDYTQRATTSFDDDIVFVSGTFMQYPDPQH